MRRKWADPNSTVAAHLQSHKFFFFLEGTVPESARQPPYVCFCGRGPRKKRHTQKVIPPDWQVHGVSWPFIQLSKADAMFGRGITNRSKRSTLLPFDHHPKDLGWASYARVVF